MVRRLLSQFYHLALADQVFLVLIVAVLITLAVAIVFALATIKLRIGNTRKAARWAKLESAWRPLLFAILAGEKPLAALTSEVDTEDRLFFLDYLSQQAARMTGASRLLLRDLAEPFIPLLEKRLTASDYEQRARAVFTFGLFASERHQADFIRMLDDSSPLVAMTAARALAGTHHLIHAPALFARITRFETWSPKFLATIFLGMGPGVAPLLRKKLADPAVPILARLVAVEVLIELHDPQGADTAAALLAGSETDVNLRAAALQLITTVGRPHHLPVIRAELESGNPILRSHAATALGTLAAPAAPVDLDRLEVCLGDDSIWVAIQAAGALIRAGGRARLVAITATTHPRAELVRQFLTQRRAA